MGLFTAIGTALGATLLGSATLAGAAVVGGAALVGGSLYYQNQAANQQRRMAQFQQRQANLNAARQRRDTIRANRLAAAQQLVTSHGQGVESSSGAMGGLDSIRSQGYSRLSFIDTMNRLSDQASTAYGKAISHGNTANMLGGLASLVSSFYKFSVTKPNEALPQSNYRPGQVYSKSPLTYQLNPSRLNFGSTK